MSTTVNRGAQRSGQRTPQRGIVIRTPGNRFDLDLDRRPPGTTYEWKRHTMMGKEDVEHQINLEANGWTAVPAGRHPELSGTRLDKDGAIIRGGMILMERPVEITEEAEELDRFAARNQVAGQLRRLKLAGHTEAGKGVKRTIAPPPDVADD